MTRPPHVGRGEEVEGGGGPPASGQSQGVLHPRQSGACPGRAPLSRDAGGAGRREKPGRGGGAGAQRLPMERGRGSSQIASHTRVVECVRLPRLSRPPALALISQLRDRA